VGLGLLHKELQHAQATNPPLIRLLLFSHLNWSINRDRNLKLCVLCSNSLCVIILAAFVVLLFYLFSIFSLSFSFVNIMNPLPAIITPALLSSLRSHPNLPGHTWYFIAATTLSQLNRPDEIPKVYQHALRHGSSGDAIPSQDEKLRISRRIREALIKAAAVGGVPRVLTDSPSG
jgi:hypothetical protein